MALSGAHTMITGMPDRPPTHPSPALSCAAPAGPAGHPQHAAGAPRPQAAGGRWGWGWGWVPIEDARCCAWMGPKDKDGLSLPSADLCTFKCCAASPPLLSSPSSAGAGAAVRLEPEVHRGGAGKGRCSPTARQGDCLLSPCYARLLAGRSMHAGCVAVLHPLERGLLLRRPQPPAAPLAAYTCGMCPSPQVSACGVVLGESLFQATNFRCSGWTVWAPAALNCIGIKVCTSTSHECARSATTAGLV